MKTSRQTWTYLYISNIFAPLLPLCYRKSQKKPGKFKGKINFEEFISETISSVT